MQCEYCEKVLSTLSSLKHHQKTAKFCLAKQNKEPTKEYICSFCGTAFAVKSTLNSHLRICKANTPVVQEQLHLLDENSRELTITKQKLIEKDKIIFERDLLISEQKIIIKELQTEYKRYMEMQNKDLQDRMQCMAEKAIERTWETVVEIEQETETPEESIDEPYELVPLELDNGYIIGK